MKGVVSDVTDRFAPNLSIRLSEASVGYNRYAQVYVKRQICFLVTHALNFFPTLST